MYRDTSFLKISIAKACAIVGRKRAKQTAIDKSNRKKKQKRKEAKMVLFVT